MAHGRCPRMQPPPNRAGCRRSGSELRHDSLQISSIDREFIVSRTLKRASFYLYHFYLLILMGRPAGKQTGITLGYCDTDSGQRVYPPPDLLDEQIPPVPGTIKPKVVANIDTMFASLTSWPPLGRPTIVPAGQSSIPFTVVLETNNDNDLQDEDMTLCIWYGQDDQGLTEQRWNEQELELDRQPSNPLSINASKGRSQRIFRGQLSAPGKGSSLSFTVKFQTRKDTSWKWIRDHTGVSDGQILFNKGLGDEPLTTFFDDSDEAIIVTKTHPDTPETLLYSLTAPVSASSRSSSGLAQYELGTPNAIVKWFALVRLWAPWLAPRQGTGHFQLDKEAVLVSFLRNDGKHVVVLGLSGIGDVTTLLQHDDRGRVIISARNDQDEEGIARVLVAVAETFEVANAAVMYEARKVVMSKPSTTAEMEREMTALAQPIKPQWFENWYDGFTYCTWNSLGQRLTEQRLLDALDDLHASGIKIENLIIDDNWQSNADGESQFQRGWLEFEANKEGFPRGLKATIGEIRMKYPHIRHIAVWHAMMGYWGGISPDGQIAKNYATEEVDIDMSIIDGPRLVVSASDITWMYSDFYAFLVSCGVDSVKTDVQFYLDQLVSAKSRRSLITAYQDAWTLAQLRHFSSRSISCMSQSPSIIFHSQLPTNRPSIPLRNSDDFFPDVDASHPWHIFCNAHNSLLTQHLNVVPDWDMFQTAHPWAWFHGAARAVSGGPIYFTDAPGAHDAGLIDAMTALTPDLGRRVTLRPHRTGRSMEQYVGYQDQALVRVGTYVGYARTGTGIVGAFNCLQNALSEFVHLKSFPGAEDGVEYVVRDFHGAVSKVAKLGDSDALVKLDLDVRGWAILSAHPVKTFKPRKGSESKIASLGLVGKLTGVAAVLGYDAYLEDNGRVRLWVNLKAVGVLGVYVSNLAEKSIDDNVMVLLGGSPLPRSAVRISTASTSVLEIDYESVWQEDRARDVQSYVWGNEVSLEVFIS